MTSAFHASTVRYHRRSCNRVAGLLPSQLADARAPTKMADLLVATTTLENKKGEKVNASEALKGKVVALYVRLALSRTAPPAVAVAPAPAESASPCARQLTCSRSAAGSSPRTGARPAAVRAARSNHAKAAQHQAGRGPLRTPQPCCLSRAATLHHPPVPPPRHAAQASPRSWPPLTRWPTKTRSASRWSSSPVTRARRHIGLGTCMA